MSSFVRVGPFLCEPNLAATVELFINSAQPKSKIADMVAALSETTIYVREKEDVSLAQFNKRVSTIYLQTGYGEDQINPLYRTAKKTWLFAMEVCNVVFYDCYAAVDSRSLTADQYVERMEFIEFTLIHKAAALIGEIKSMRPELAECRHLQFPKTFEDYCALQKQFGHSDQFAKEHALMSGQPFPKRSLCQDRPVSR